MTEPECLVRIRVWDRVVRATHWVIALSIALLSITGIYIGHPFIIVTGEARDHFVMGTIKVIHFYAAIAFTLALLTRIVWLFIGPPHARWRVFIPVDKERRVGLKETIKFYLFIRNYPPLFEGHNPAAGLTYTLVFLLCLLMAATGVGLYGMDAAVGSWMRGFRVLLGLFGGAQDARWIHHATMWLLLGFVVHHVYSAILVSVVEKNGTLDSIFSGFKWIKPKEPKST
jgi:Ni/Fe-hydrogenase 1 B-type cytochrome subunit